MNTQPVQGAAEAGEVPADRFDPRLALRAVGLLARFNQAGVLSAADLQVARRLAGLTGEKDELVHLAAAFAVRGVRNGSVLCTLRGIGESIEVDPGVDLQALPWPDPDAWLAALRSSPMVETGDPADGRPLRAPLQLRGEDLWLTRYWLMEDHVARELTGRSAPAGLDLTALDAALQSLWPDPADDQRIAARICALQRISVLGGGPGTGKTTTVARLLAVLNKVGDHPPRIALAAPTGKAAARLSEAVAGAAVHDPALDDDSRALLSGLQATTLHRLLGVRRGSSRFWHNAANRLQHDVVVVDEASMISLTMFTRLLEALRPSARLVLVGDPHQLASVEAGAVLADLVESGGAGVAMLRKVRRFDAGGPIDRLARAIRGGRTDEVLELLSAGDPAICWSETDDEGAVGENVLHRVRADLESTALPMLAAARDGDAATALSLLDRHRLMCAHRHGPRGVDRWSAYAERWLAESDPLLSRRRDGRYPGLPLLVTANDYDNALWNGDTGVVLADGEALQAVFGHPQAPRLLALGRLGEVTAMHAMTVHRSQGSQFDRVTLVLPQSDSLLTSRETLYTGITRAISSVHVIGSRDAVRTAVTRPALRATGLARRLHGP